MYYHNYRPSMSRGAAQIRRDIQNTSDCCDALDNMALAMAYVPWQKWQNIWEAEKGFCHGTIFQELNLPFEGVGGCQQ